MPLRTQQQCFLSEFGLLRIYRVVIKKVLSGEKCFFYIYILIQTVISSLFLK